MAQAQSPTGRHQIPVWVGIILVFASLGIGIWLLMGEGSKPKTVTQVTVPMGRTTNEAPLQSMANEIPAPKIAMDPGAANWDKKIFNVKSTDAMRKTSESSWSIKGGRLFMQVRRDKTGKPEVRFCYPFDDMLSKETIAMLRARWSSWDTKRPANGLQISAAQLEALMAVDAGTDAQVSKADIRMAVALFEDAIAAANASEMVNGGHPTVAEEKLTDAVRDLDEKYYQRTLDKANRIAAEVKAIFSDEQYAGLMRRFGTW